MRTAVGAFVVAWVAAAVVQAAPLEPKHIGADAKWVVHVDVDAMHDSTLVTKAYEKEAARHENADKWLASVVERTGMDPTKDLHGVTAYGSKPGEGQGVILVHAKANRTKLLEMAKKAPDFAESEHEGFKVYSWSQPDGKTFGAFHGENIVLFAKTAEQIHGALDVLLGRFPNLAGTESPLTREAPTGALLVVRAVGINEVELPLRNPAAERVRTLDVVLGEADGKTFLDAALVTEAAEVAEQIRNIVEGVRAMATLQAGQDPEVAQLINAVKTNVSGETLTISAEVPVDQVWDMMEKAWNRRLERRAQ